MPENVKVFSSRRAYVYRADAIRLTVLTRSSSVIQEAFNFQASQLGRPSPTFGQVPAVVPPGLVFAEGSFTRPDGTLVPIRFINIEPRRVVVDVAGPSDLIGHVFERLRELVADLRSPDGRPALEEHESVLDSSEIVSRLSFRPEQLVPEPLRPLIHDALPTGADQSASVLVPLLQVRTQRTEAEYEGAVIPFPMLHLEPRGGTRLDQRTYYSMAPLPSPEHISLLGRIEEALSRPPQ